MDKPSLFQNYEFEIYDPKHGKLGQKMTVSLEINSEKFHNLHNWDENSKKDPRVMRRFKS